MFIYIYVVFIMSVHIYKNMSCFIVCTCCRYNTDLFRSMRRLVDWQVTLPIPPPPKGIHEKFTKCLANIKSVDLGGDDAYNDDDGKKKEKAEGAEEEDDGVEFNDPKGVTHLDDTKVLKKLKREELEEANRDAKKACWIGNSLVR
jgi:hypothetical protein